MSIVTYNSSFDSSKALPLLTVDRGDKKDPPKQLLAKERWKSAIRATVRKAIQEGDRVRDQVVTARQLYPSIKNLYGTSITELEDVCHFLARQILLSQDPECVMEYLEPGDNLRISPGNVWHKFQFFKYPSTPGRIAAELQRQAPNLAKLDRLPAAEKKQLKQKIKRAIDLICDSEEQIIGLDYQLWLQRTLNGKKINLILVQSGKNIEDDKQEPSYLGRGTYITAFRAQHFAVPLHLDLQLKGVQSRPIKYSEQVLLLPSIVDDQKDPEKNKCSRKDAIDEEKTRKKGINIQKELIALAKKDNKEPCVLEIPQILGLANARKIENGNVWVIRLQRWANALLTTVFFNRKLPLDMDKQTFRNVSTIECMRLLLDVSTHVEQYFHRHGRVHRDLKSSNLMVKARSADSPLKVYIIDPDTIGPFGIARGNKGYFLWDEATRLGWNLPSSDVYALSILLLSLFFPNISFCFQNTKFYEKVAGYPDPHDPNGCQAVCMKFICQYIEMLFNQFKDVCLGVRSLDELYRKIKLLQPKVFGTDLLLLQKLTKEIVAIEIIINYLVEVCSQSMDLAEYLEGNPIGSSLKELESLSYRFKPEETKMKRKELEEKIFPKFKEMGKLSALIDTLEKNHPALTMAAFQAKCQEVLKVLGDTQDPLEKKG